MSDDLGLPSPSPEHRVPADTAPEPTKHEPARTGQTEAAHVGVPPQRAARPASNRADGADLADAPDSPDDPAASADDGAVDAAPAGAPVPARRRRGRGRRARRAGLVALAVVVVLVAAVAGTGVWAVRTAFPQYDGQLRISGLRAPVTVYRDRYAIPQVYASSAADLFTAQGYLHAQERFWEMDFRRHLTSGRLAELFGESQVETDAYLRTMGWRRVAEQEWSLVSPQTRQYLQDYADGVNAYLRTHSASSISLEYSVLKLTNPDYTIAPWDPIDSLAWLKAMAWDLRGNMDDEIERATLLADGLSRDQIEQLYPPYPYAEHAPIVTAPAQASTTAVGGTAGGGVSGDVLTAAVPELSNVDKALRALPDLSDDLPGIGSNSWVIAGDHTDTGKPILANDPHLAPSMPGIWYQMGLHCTCAYNVEGFTFSGVPGVVIGHNGRIAWGFTNLDPDVTDLYLEKVRGDQYEVDGRWRDLQVREETINVAGGKPVTLTVRSTDNGPLLSDASDELRTIAAKPDVDPSGAPLPTAGTPTGGDGAADGTHYAVALRWTALDPGRTMDALFALDTAGDWDQFRAAAAQFEVPAQNMVYADVDGNIGYQSPGRIPVRGKGDGRWPAPGWDSAYDWKGYLPFDELPSERNPPQGFIATANQAVIDPRQYSHFLTDDWSYGYRSQRIADMISSMVASGATVSVADVARMQFDNRNNLAPALVPALLAVPLTGAARRAQDLLRDWDFQEPADGDADTAQGRDSAAAAFFNAVWRQLLPRLFDELPVDERPDGSDRWWLVVTNLLSQPDSPWWDVKGTPQVEKRDDILSTAMTEADAELITKLGDDPAGWRWGDLHKLYVQNQSFGTSGVAPIEWLFNYGPVGVSGGSNIVNATGWNPSDGYGVNAVPSMRMVVDMSNLDGSRWVQLTGESGHAFSAHYHDQFDLWRTGGTLPMRWDEAAIKSSAAHTLTLRP